MNIEWRSGAVGMSDAVYRVESGIDGFVAVARAEIGGEFEEVPAEGERPPNRDGALCLKYDEKRFVMIGGESAELRELEIWRFSVAKRRWRRLAGGGAQRARRYHCGAFADEGGRRALYVFGGMHGTDVLGDLLVVAFAGGAYECRACGGSGERPPARWMGAMAAGCGGVWLFGGLSQLDRPLGDFWRMSHEVFERAPAWERLPSLPPARCAPAAWCSDAGVCVAGGVGAKRQRLNDVWRFAGGEWEQTNIFVAECAVHFWDGVGLCAVAGGVARAETRSPFAGLDAFVNRLKAAQKSLSTHIRIEEDALRDIRSLNEKIVRQCGVLRAYARDRKRTPEVQQIVENFSGEYLREINEKGEMLKKELAAKIHMVIDEVPEIVVRCSEDDDKRINLMRDRIYLKYRHGQIRFDKMRDDLEFEIGLYQEQIDKLEAKKKNLKEPKIDAADYTTFDLFTSNFAKSEQQKALSLFYGLQLREYQQLKSELCEVQKKIENVEKKKQKCLEITNAFSGILINKFSKVNGTNEMLETWNRNIADVENAQKTMKNYLNSFDECKSNPKEFQNKTETIRLETQNLTEKLHNSIQTITSKKKDEFEKMYECATKLSESLNSRSTKEFRQNIQQSLNVFNNSLLNIMKEP